MVKGVWLCPSLYDLYKQQTSINKERKKKIGEEEDEEEEEKDNNNDNNDNDDNDTTTNNNSNNNDDDDDDDDGDDINCPTSFLALCKDFFFFHKKRMSKLFLFALLALL